MPKWPEGRRQTGFTMVELVMVMIVVGILAVAIFPRFANKQSFDEMGYHDRVKAVVEFARKTAIAQRRNACVNVAAGALAVTQGVSFGAACTVPLTDPTKGTQLAVNPALEGVTLPLTSTLSPIIFDAQGSTPVTATLTVGPRTITVWANTGYVQ